MHILAFTPTFADALRSETVASVVAQRWGGRLTWEIGRHNPYPAPDIRNVAPQYAEAQRVFLAGDYDALWVVEHDMTFGPHTLQTLVDTDVDVAYAPYMLRHNSHMVSALHYAGEQSIGESLTAHPDELARARQAGHWLVSGIGFGCTLIRRHVLQEIAFRPDENGHAPDMPFAQDALRAGFASVARFEVEAGHIENGMELTVSNGDLPAGTVEVVAEQDVNISGGVHLTKGETYTLARDLAVDLMRTGYVSIIVAKKAKTK